MLDFVLGDGAVEQPARYGDVLAAPGEPAQGLGQAERRVEQFDVVRVVGVQAVFEQRIHEIADGVPDVDHGWHPDVVDAGEPDLFPAPEAEVEVGDLAGQITSALHHQPGRNGPDSLRREGGDEFSWSEDTELWRRRGGRGKRLAVGVDQRDVGPYGLEVRVAVHPFHHPGQHVGLHEVVVVGDDDSSATGDVDRRCAVEFDGGVGGDS